MKTSKRLLGILTIALVVLFFGWMQLSKKIVSKLEAQGSSSSEYSAANKSRAANTSSLYYRYMQMLKERSKKHKV